MISFLDTVKKAPHIAVDTESDHAFNNLFLGISVAYLNLGMYFPVGHLEADVNIDDEVFEYTIDTIKNHQLRVFQHAGYDLSRFEDIGHPLDGDFVCTMDMSHMIKEELKSKSLDTLHKFFVKGGEGKLRHPLMQQIIDTMGWRYVPVYLINEYAIQDAVATSELYYNIEPRYRAEFGKPYEWME